jgi:GT2 family glycosyltransferase
MGSTPTLSVILATCDRPALVADALRSVAMQTRPPIDVRIGDDGVTPAADAVEVPAGLPVTWVRTRAGCAAAARNLAAHGARGEVLAFLDDDDRWLPLHLERLASAFDDPAVELAYTDAVVVREQVDRAGARIELERRTLARGWDPQMMRVNDWIAPSAFAVRRSRFESLGGFDATFTMSEDWDFLLRAARHATPHRVAGVTVEVRMRESGNHSADFGPERRACLARLAARHGLPPLEPRTFWEVAEVLARAQGRG